VFSPTLEPGTSFHSVPALERERRVASADAEFASRSRRCRGVTQPVGLAPISAFFLGLYFGSYRSSGACVGD
jgi:hypothetical protein